MSAEPWWTVLSWLWCWLWTGHRAGQWEEMQTQWRSDCTRCGYTMQRSKRLTPDGWK